MIGITRKLVLVALTAVAAALPRAATARPTLWIIGDSTVRTWTSGQQGWGDPLVREFDPGRIAVVNRAIGGRSSRTFLTEGRWDAILAHLQPGDYVLMQFGHNDGGQMFEGPRPRASIKGNGEETVAGAVEATGKSETVHSFGWYLRKFCRDAKAKGATPIVVSLIPRNLRGEDGRIIRADQDYALWARQGAEQAGAHFIDLNAILARRYDALGMDEVGAIFATPDHTHTSPGGAAFNAAVLAGELRNLEQCNLGSHLRDADLWLPRIFTDHMVLQRDLAIPVWGRTRPRTPVVVSLAGHKVSTDSGPDGNWSLTLPPQPAGGPFVLEVAGAATRALSDVMIGEVWLCSGQSNMDFTVAATPKRYFAGTRHAKEEIAAANFPRIRMFTAEWSMHDAPMIDVEGAWKVCSPDTVGDFSAVAYFFGRDLHRDRKVPVGLITCAYGGSTAEAWTSAGKFADHPQLAPLLKAFGQKRRAYRDHPKTFEDYGHALARRTQSVRQGTASGRAPRHPDPVQDQHNPTVLFNGMIAPVIPYAIRGAIWYQGESNVGTRHLYPALQQALIEDWRERWGLGDFPFYFVQLANYKDAKGEPADSAWASMRAAQEAALALPRTGMAVTIDLGEARDIHPRNKQDVGHRLARLALAGTYGRPFVPSGPSLKSATVDGDAILLKFHHAAGGLVARNGPLKHFAIAGRDKKFVWAEASIRDMSVVVRSPEVPRPAYVRYAWADNPESANLYNSEGLPAAPFRTDP